MGLALPNYIAQLPCNIDGKKGIQNGLLTPNGLHDSVVAAAPVYSLAMAGSTTWRWDVAGTSQIMKPVLHPTASRLVVDGHHARSVT